MIKKTEGVRDSPRTLGGIMRMLGPGIIMAGGIVGSGELIAATRTGAETGFIFLGLIIFGCVIKCFTQVEMARHAIARNETTLTMLNNVPGPRVCVGRFNGNWIVLFWGITMLIGIGQLGGIVGGVGQAMAITMPLTEKGRSYNEAADNRARLQVVERNILIETNSEILESLYSQERLLRSSIVEFDFDDKSADDRCWALILAVLASVMLVRGGFGFIEAFAAVLVGSFTLVTIFNLLALQSQPEWAIRSADIRLGLGIDFISSGKEKVVLALATFGIIGVGASEIVAYPYWCLEKGYGRWTGARENNDVWLFRARGWLRVMQWDAWISMLVYTFCTVVFYLLGASVLGRLGMVPEKHDLIRTLSVMYAPVFSGYAQWVFLIGAISVLFSTFFISNATKCRLFTDVASVTEMVKHDEARRRKWIRVFGAILPMLCVLVYIVWPNPGQLVLMSGVFQSMLLPMLAFAVLWLRYRETDTRLLSGRFWDIMLWASFMSFVGIGLYLTITKLGKLFS